MHEPQLAVLLLMSISQPLLEFPSQLLKPAVHSMSHIPFTQRASLFDRIGQRTPQPPQLFGSAAVFTSQPFAPMRSQSAVLAGHIPTASTDESSIASSETSRLAASSTSITPGREHAGARATNNHTHRPSATRI